jgi:hypothetical protein
MANVPDDWTMMIADHRAAMVAWDQMRDPGASQTMRDEATVRYNRAADAVIQRMARLSEQQVLGRITLHLARKERP